MVCQASERIQSIVKALEEIHLLMPL